MPRGIRAEPRRAASKSTTLPAVCPTASATTRTRHERRVRRAGGGHGVGLGVERRARSAEPRPTTQRRAAPPAATVTGGPAEQAEHPGRRTSTLTATTASATTQSDAVGAERDRADHAGGVGGLRERRPVEQPDPVVDEVEVVGADHRPAQERQRQHRVEHHERQQEDHARPGSTPATCGDQPDAQHRRARPVAHDVEHRAERGSPGRAAAPTSRRGCRRPSRRRTPRPAA